ncbi:Na+/H+ antiporter subunit E [Tabrizicola aquatica]|uniref:Na+/H+ antiporter subunit E n=1 Tax=Tabrizicola aquatica TaxID=909926 RepID=UPI000CCFD7E8|nr:Na+/H+ antiporter subunit E [Tabrizicola aquatica]
MTRLLPHPLLSLGLLLLWLVLTRFSLGHLVLGSVIALGAGLVFARLEPAVPRRRRVWPLLRLAGIVAVDIVRSNLAVAWLILSDGRNRRSGFVEIPLRLQDPGALALLALILTATPGTAWLEHDRATGVLLLHVFDLKDPEEWRVLIRDRYEALLLEAFG